MRKWTNDTGSAGSYSAVFDAFGQVVSQSGSRPPYGFGADWAYRDDGDAGLLHIDLRWYDPAIGRWITADKYLGSIFDPLSLNRYLYCLNDPVNCIDPDGRQNRWLPFLRGVSITITVGVLAIAAALKFKKWMEEKEKEPPGTSQGGLYGSSHEHQRRMIEQVSDPDYREP